MSILDHRDQKLSFIKPSHYRLIQKHLSKKGLVFDSFIQYDFLFIPYFCQQHKKYLPTVNLLLWILSFNCIFIDIKPIWIPVKYFTKTLWSQTEYFRNEYGLCKELNLQKRKLFSETHSIERYWEVIWKRYK